VIYFRKLNDVTIGDSFSTPVVSEILVALDNSKYFTMIDCMSGFLHIPIKLKDQKKKTEFSTREGHFQYKE
jgi:hypothetical protein